MGRLSPAALARVRAAVPETVEYLYTDEAAGRAYFGTREPRLALAWLGLWQWRRRGRPQAVALTVSS